MKLSELSNNQFIINYKNGEEFNQAERMVEWIENDTEKRVVCAATDHYEDEDECVGYFHMSTYWEYYQAEGLKYLYSSAKKATK